MKKKINKYAEWLLIGAAGVILILIIAHLTGAPEDRIAGKWADIVVPDGHCEQQTWEFDADTRRCTLLTRVFEDSVEIYFLTTPGEWSATSNSLTLRMDNSRTTFDVTEAGRSYADSLGVDLGGALRERVESLRSSPAGEDTYRYSTEIKNTLVIGPEERPACYFRVKNSSCQ